jgi:hypothetical protein
LSGPLAIGPNTTAWFNTDLNTASGYLIWGWAGGAEYNLNIKSDGTAALYTGAGGQTLVLDNIQLAYSSNHQSVEFAIPKAALGNPAAIDTYYTPTLREPERITCQTGGAGFSWPNDPAWLS